MNKHIAISLFYLCLTAVFANPSIAAGDYNNDRALAGVDKASVYFDLNVGNPAKLLTRLRLIDRTWNEMKAASVKPEFVVGIRGNASYFSTKGEDYVISEDLETKKKVHEWLQVLEDKGVVVEQCLIAAELHRIDPKDFLPIIDVVRNGYISMAGYSAQGYSRIPMD